MISNLVFTESIRSVLDESKYVCGIFVDLQKAFDTFNHKILLDKLHHYGMHGNMNEWFESYSPGRKQIISIDGADSELRELKHVVFLRAQFWDLYYFSSTQMT